ncbi:hypothetical protein [Cellulomonas fimi]|uniref:hypothetical protein n=1 Tax=Cellulomonas fimi TaxID=1708 RepID=UPI002358470B|nr:hypothetical protein [Cellulomonas fimi]
MTALPPDATVTWTAHAFGLSPVVTGDAQADERTLLALLDDPDRFVLAHVLLTRDSGVRHETYPTYNGLAVDVRADGTVHVDPAQRAPLRRRWAAWAASDPRPDALPADPGA